MTIQSDRFSKFVFLSFGLHLGSFALFTLKVLVFPEEIPSYKQSIRVDIVALPEKRIFPEKKTEPGEKVQVKKQIKKSPEMKPLKPKKEKSRLKERRHLKEEQNSAVARLKALKHLGNRKKTKKQEYKGNIVNKGFSLKGLEKLHHKSYLDQLDSHIRSYWNLPEWLSSANLNARVLIRIDKDGNIFSRNLILGSGNEFFDQSVFKALEKASPLPPPPENLADFYFTKGVEFRFPE